LLSTIRTANAVKLGGTLTANTDIPLAGYNLAFSGTGNVGIGLTNPTSKLYIQSSTGNLLTINDTVGDLVNVSSAQTTINNPTSFTSSGDVSIAYDLNFTNPTASYIKSTASLYIQAGETFGSSDLTLKTYNAGDVVLDAAGGVTLAQAQNWDLADSSTTSLNIESGLMNFDTTNSRIGIGTTTPSSSLEVNGAVELTNLYDTAAATGDNFFDGGCSSTQTVSGIDSTGAITCTSITGVPASSVPFSGITSGTNVAAAMVVGTGASLTYHDGVAVSGEINASLLQNATWASPLAIGTSNAAAGTFTTLTSTGITTLGNNTATVEVNSSDWDISTAGNMTGIGAVTMDGLLTGTLGATITGAAVNLNASSNFATNINTGTSTGAVTIGNATGAMALALNSGTGDIILTSTDQIKLNSSKAAGGTTTEALSLKSTVDLGAADEVLQIGDSALDMLTILGNGNVGIGTTNPNEKLEASGASAAIRLTDTDTAGVGRFRFYENTTNIGDFQFVGSAHGSVAERNWMEFVNRTATGGVSFWTNGTQQMSINSSGNVGIGITNPTYDLDLTGDFNITSGGIRADGTFGTSGQVLSSTGTGVEWTDMTGGTGTQYWQWNGGVLSPTDLNDSVNLGATATNSATVHLAGKSGDNSFINTGNFGVGLTNPGSKLTVVGTASVSGGQINLNASSNYATNINTGTSNGAVTIGGNSNTVAVNSNSWDISTTGAVSGVTTISMSGQLTNTLATGTSPFAVTSTTVNTNLNADYLDGQHGAYYAPLANITGNVNRLAKFTGTNSVGDASINDLNTGVVMTIGSTGFIGIGTTTPSQLLQVGTGTGFLVNGNGAIMNANGATISGSVRFSSMGTGIIHSNSNGYLSSSAVGLAGSDVTGVLPLANGGTANNNATPYSTGKFIAFDGTKLASTIYDQASFETALTFGNGLTRTLNAVTWGGTLTGVTTIAQAGYDVAFTGIGNFGIGTAIPSQKFDVGGFFVVNTTDSRVGIGTTDPQATLDISGATSTITNTTGDITFNSASGFFDFSGDSLKNFLNATVSGQLALGNFQEGNQPYQIGTGSFIYNTTQGNPQFYNGTAWISLSNYFSRLTTGNIYPNNWYDSIIIGASTGNGASSSATVRISPDATNSSFFLNPVAFGFRTDNPTTNAIHQPVTGYTFAIQTNGGILPRTDGTDLLGSIDHNWQDLYISNEISRGNVAMISLGTTDGPMLTGDLWHADQGFLVGAGTITAGKEFGVEGDAYIEQTLEVGGLVTIGGGTGKLDVGTVDPPYTINGIKYGTFMASMIGIKEETVGNVTTTDGNYIEGLGYRTLIDLDQQPVGSDIWLFSKTTKIKDHIGDLSVLLTPEGQAKAWYEVDEPNKILAIYSSTPTTISYRLTAPRFDAKNWSNLRNSPSVGHIINDTTAYTNQNSIFENPVTSPELIAKIDGSYKLMTNGTENKEISSFMKSIIANLTVGAAVMNNLIAENLTVTGKLVSPIADIGELNALNATISGTLYADNIKSSTLDSLDSQINLLNEKYSTASGILAELQAKYSTYDSLLGATSSAEISSDPLALSPLATTSAIIPSDLALNSLNVHTLITNDLLANGVIFTKSISAFDTDLYIQPTGDKLVYISDDLMILYPDGKIVINGDLLINGKIIAEGLDTKTATVSGTLAVGSSKIASESANFNQLTTSGLIIASGKNPQATISAQTNSNATIGTATIAANTNQISIINNKITPTTLIYITPTSDTDGRVLFVKSKTEGVGFTVGITGNANNSPLTTFNYWLVETK